MKNHKFTTLIIIIILAITFGIYNWAKAASASVYISPASASKNVGDEFTISVGVDPGGQEVCYVEGKLIFNDKLSCQGDISQETGISAQTSPSCSNLSFAFGIQGCTTVSKTLFTVKVKAASAGTGTASFSGVDILSENISLGSASSNGSYTITASCTCTDWSAWQNGACGGGSCDATQRLQTRTRTCTPSGCETESQSQCVNDSSCVASTTTPTTTQPTTTTTTIQPPTNLSASDVPNDNGTAIKISWSASPTSDITGYYILRKLSSESSYKTVATVAKNVLSYTDTTCTPGKIYDYSVVAYKGSWNTRSSWPTKVTATAINNLGATEETTPTTETPITETETETETKFEISIDETGKVTAEFLGVSADNNVTITVPKDIIAATETGEPVKEITVKPTTISEETISSGTLLIAGAAYDFGPDGATFSEPIEVTIKYDPTALPEGAEETTLVIKMFDGTNWISLPTTVDTENHIATTKVSHFTSFALFAEEKKVTTSPIETTPYEEPSNWQLIVGLVIAILAIVGFIVYYKKQK